MLIGNYAVHTLIQCSAKWAPRLSKEGNELLDLDTATTGLPVVLLLTIAVRTAWSGRSEVCSSSTLGTVKPAPA